MKHVIAKLEVDLNTLINNEPIHRREGETAQADLAAETAAEIRRALRILRAVDD